MRIVEHAKGEKISLTNDGELSLFFIGVGSAFAKRNNQTNLLIVKGNDHVLVDCGETGPLALSSVAGLSSTDIRVVLPTHSHPDHVNGIASLGIDSRYVGMRRMNHPKIKMVINEEYQRILWTHTLQGALEWNESLNGGVEHLGFSDYFDVIRPEWSAFRPREVWTVDVGCIHLEMFRTKHIPEQSKGWEVSFVSYGLLIDYSVFYSGDTRFDPDLIDMYRHSEAMFHDVQFFPGAVHAPLSDLKTLSPALKSKMHLVHYADNWESQDISDFAGWTRQGVWYVFDEIVQA